MNGRKLAIRVGRAVLAVALVALVAVFVVQAVPGVIGAEHSYVVLSNSMSPGINPGDSVIVGSVDPAAIEVGDVITFDREADQPPVTHRVVDVLDGGGELAFRTAGDNNEDVDPGTVPASAVIGKVWFTIPLVGHVVQFANQPAGAAVLIGVPIALFALSELWARSGPTTVRSTAAAGTSEREATAAPTDGDKVLPRFEDRTAPIADGGETGDDAISISGTELRLGALGFGTFAIYAAYVAVGNPSGISVGVAVGAAIAAGFHLAGLALFAFAGDAEPDDGAPVADAAHGGGADD